MAKILCVLYEDPESGYPPPYPRDEIPKIERYFDGQTTPTPEAIDFTPGELLGCVSGELGLRKFLEAAGHELIVTSDKDGADSVFERELPEAEVVISQPFWPAYLTAERIAKAPEPEARDHRRDRLRSRRSPGCDRERDHGRRGDLLKLDQRLRARGDDDSRPGAQLHPLLPAGDRGRLEHRRLRGTRVRRRGDAGRHRRRRANRLSGLATPEAIRGRVALHRPPPAPGRGRVRARGDLPRKRGGHGRGL